MVLSLVVPVIKRLVSLNLNLNLNPQWTNKDLETFVHYWLLSMNMKSCRPAMFLLYHSEGCNICESVLRECYVNDLYTTT
jgi:hypothetical protein